MSFFNLFPYIPWQNISLPNPSLVRLSTYNSNWNCAGPHHHQKKPNLFTETQHPLFEEWRVIYFSSHNGSKSLGWPCYCFLEEEEKSYITKKTGTTPVIAGRFPRYLLYISLQVKKKIVFLKKQTCFCRIYKQKFWKLLGPDHVQ